MKIPASMAVAFGSNDFIVQGVLVQHEVRKTGAAMIWLDTAPGREESEVRNAPVPSFFTSVLAIRVPKRAVASMGELETGGIYVAKGHVQGVKRVLDGQPFYLTELQASYVRRKDLVETAEDPPATEDPPAD